MDCRSDNCQPIPPESNWQAAVGKHLRKIRRLFYGECWIDCPMYFLKQKNFHTWQPDITFQSAANVALKSGRELAMPIYATSLNTIIDWCRWGTVTILGIAFTRDGHKLRRTNCEKESGKMILKKINSKELHPVSMLSGDRQQ
jgi:hypothetical protein